MKHFIKPTVVVSKCLEFDPCRFNGDVIQDATVRSLFPYVTCIPVCPEVEIGLGTPRDPIRIVEVDDERRLLQPSTKRDITDAMHSFAQGFLSTLDEVDGFLLKSRSPSCGTKDVKVYTGLEKATVKETGAGLFGKHILETFGFLAIEEEGRLKNFSIREHFLTKLFTLATFRQMKRTNKSVQSVMQFHSSNKYLFMAYNQTELKQMGRILANHEKRSLEDLFTEYEQHLYNLFKRAPRYTSNINVCSHIMGYFKNELSQQEKAHFVSMLERYKEKKIPLSTLTTLLKSWSYRFQNDYLYEQTYFEPYPEQLVELNDSGKGRDFQ